MVNKDSEISHGNSAYSSNPYISYSQYSSFDDTLAKYLSEKSISEMIKVNSEIRRILARFKIPIKINMKILRHLVKNHLPATKKIALGIAEYLPDTYKPFVNKKALAEATCLHDIAKVIIPENILNKAGALNKSEREIMDEHAKLSYELLKTTDLSHDTLDLIKNHHDANCSKPDINLQILSIADIYSALREKRSYKKELTKEQSLEILKKEMQKGKFDKNIYKALVAYAEKEDSGNRKRKIFNLEFVNSFSA